MNIDDLLSRFEKVRVTATGEWMACCSAHDDKSPSLAIKDAGDGRVLIHCFGGCETVAVLAMIGLRLTDVMPDNRLGSVEGLKKLPWNPRTVLEAIAFNATAIAIAASDIAYGKKLSIADADTLANMSREIHEAIKYATR